MTGGEFQNGRLLQPGNRPNLHKCEVCLGLMGDFEGDYFSCNCGNQDIPATPSDWEDFEEILSLPDLGDVELDDEYLDMLAGETDEEETPQISPMDSQDKQLDTSSAEWFSEVSPTVPDKFIFPPVSFPRVTDTMVSSAASACVVPSSQGSSPSPASSVSRCFSPDALLPSSSSSECGSMRDPLNVSNPSTPALSSPTTPAPVGQMTFHCARCKIVYLSLEQMEKHVQTFHLRHCRNFELHMDNVDTWVRFVWEPSTTSFNTGFIRRPMDIMKPLYTLPKTFGHLSTMLPLQGYPNETDYADILDSEMSDGTESDWDLSTSNFVSSTKLNHLSVAERIEMEMPGPLKLPTAWSDTCTYKKKVKPPGRPRKNLKGSGNKLVIRKPLKATILEATRHVDWMVTNVGKLIKQKAAKSGNKYGKSKSKNTMDFVRKTLPVKVESRESTVELLGDGEFLPRKRLAKNVGRKSSLRKCRGVYGISNQAAWCNMCRWKKRCSRFGEGAENGEHDSQ